MIYNNCDGSYWDGIVVEGDPNLGDFTNFQGFCRLNSATIKNAHIGVRCQDGVPGANTWGGIVWANFTSFLNCRKHAVEIRSFGGVKPPSHWATGDANEFVGCQFIEDGSRMDSLSTFQSMVRLKAVRGVRFVGCTFSNSYPVANIQARNDCIEGINAGFTLQGFALPNGGPVVLPSTITGFRRGVFANSSYNTSIKVNHNKFEDNWIGVYMNSCNNATILDNDFDVGSNLPLELPSYIDRANMGIALYRCRGYKIEENTFTRHAGLGTENPVGILSFSSGPYYNEIYKNYFQDMVVANLANNGNRSLDPNKGLQYLCNESLGGNDFDIAVTGSTPNVVGSIGRNQGSTNTAAGNLFTGSPPFSDSNIKNDTIEIEYFFSSGQRPDSTSPPPFVVRTLTSNINLCESKLFEDFDGDISSTEKQQLRDDFYNDSEIGKVSNAANMLVHHFLTDSIEYNLDSARFWLAEKGGIGDHFQIVNTYIGENDATGAQTVLDSIPIIFNLVDGELTEYQFFDSLKTLQINALQRGDTEEQMVLQNQTVLNNIASAVEYGAAGEARALINEYLGEQYPPEVYLPETSDGLGRIKPPSRVVTATEHTMLRGIPNPTHSVTDFYYQLPHEMENGKIVITSFDGKIVDEVEFVGNKGKVQWDAGQVGKGVYIASLWANGQKVHNERIVVLK